MIYRYFDNINELNNYKFKKNNIYNIILNIIDNEDNENNEDNEDNKDNKELKPFNLCFNGKLTINIYCSIKELEGILNINELIINKFSKSNGFNRDNNFIILDFDTTINNLIYNNYYYYYNNNFNDNRYVYNRYVYNKYNNNNNKLYLKGNYFNLLDLNVSSNVKIIDLKDCYYNSFKLSNNLLNNILVNNNLKIYRINLMNHEIKHSNIFNLKENKSIDINNDLIIKCKENYNLYLNIINNLSNINLIGIFNECIFNNNINKLLIKNGKINNLFGKFNELNVNYCDINKLICEVNNKCNIKCNKIDYINGIFKRKTKLNVNNINNLNGDYDELTIMNCRKINFNKIKNINSLILICCDFKKFNFNLFNLKSLKLIKCNINEIGDNLINLETLEIDRCHKLKSIPNTFINLKSLKINACDNIKELDNKYINLKNLDISDCRNLKELNGFKNVQNLTIEGNYIKQINNFDNLISLEIISIYEYSTKPKLNLNSYINSCNNIKKLTLNCCSGIEYLNDKLINLEELKILYCKNIKTIPETLINLKKLKLYDCKDIKTFPKTINYLRLEKCDNIILDNNFEKLEKIEIYNCHYVKINPINTLLNVKYLKIYKCYDIIFISNDLINYYDFKTSYKNHNITELKNIFPKLEKLEIQ